MKERPSFPLMRQTDVQTIYHMQMPRWLFSDPRYADMALEAKMTYTSEPEVQEPQDLRPSYTDLSHTYPSHAEVSQSVPCGGGPADDEGELAGILDACELHCFSAETARVFENAIERLFYADSFRVGNTTLPQKRVRAKLKLLDYTILQAAEAKLHANLDRPVKNSTAYTMATIFNCIAESESDLMVDPYLNGLRRSSSRASHPSPPAEAEGSLTPPLLLSPYEPLRWVRMGTPEDGR